jgi:hypothetical protein
VLGAVTLLVDSLLTASFFAPVAVAVASSRKLAAVNRTGWLSTMESQPVFSCSSGRISTELAMCQIVPRDTIVVAPRDGAS